MGTTSLGRYSYFVNLSLTLIFNIMEVTIYLPTLFYFVISAFLGLVALNVKQRYRPPLLCLLTVFATLAYRGVTVEFASLEACHILCMFLLFYISHMTCALCMEEYVLPTTHQWDWMAAYKMLFNARWIGTKRQAPNVKESSSPPQGILSQELKPDIRPANRLKRLRIALASPRVIFIRNRLFSLFVIYVVSKLYDKLTTSLFSEYFDNLGYEDFLPDKRVYLRRLSEVTARETIIRMWFVIFWNWSTYSTVTKVHDILAIFFVGIGIDEPQDWPTLYGSLREAYTMRGFWGKFWHSLVYRSYTNYGIVISTKIFGLPRRSMVGRLLVNFLVFFLSGCIHALVELQLGYTCGWRESIASYSGSFVAILVETIVQWAFRSLVGKYRGDSVISKAIGYAWVFGYLFWSLPKVQYSKLYCHP